MKPSKKILKDSRKMREMAVSNMWPQEIMEEYHPREGFSASLKKMPEPLAFTIATLTHDGTLEELQYLMIEKLSSIPIDMMAWCNDLMPTRITGREELDVTARLISRCNQACNLAHRLKRENKVDRPSFYGEETKKMFGNTYSYPCAKSAILFESAEFLTNEFSELEDIKDVLFDTAYMIGMISVMCGHNHISDVIKI